MFRFAAPEYLYLLIVVPVLATVYAATSLRARKRLKRYGDPRLLRGLTANYSRVRPVVKFSLLLTVLALLIVMLARPQYGLSKDSVTKNGIEAVVMMDVSNSMMAADIQPSRLERSKLLVSNLIERMQNDKVALGIFAGEAYPQLPITSDYASAKMFLNAISTGMVTLQGTNLAAAIDLADKSFTDKKNVGKAIIIITDGEDHEGGAEEAARDAAKKGREIFVLGVGTAEGSQIPTREGPLLDRDGQPVTTALNEQMCRDVAKAGNGVYLHVDNTNSAQEELQSLLGQLQKSSENVEYTSYDEQFQAVGIIALLLLFSEFFMFETQNPWLTRLHIFRRKQSKQTTQS